MSFIHEESLGCKHLKFKETYKNRDLTKDEIEELINLVSEVKETELFLIERRKELEKIIYKNLNKEEPILVDK